MLAVRPYGGASRGELGPLATPATSAASLLDAMKAAG
jgi:hypothetical protein